MKKLHVAFCLRDMQMGGVESVLIRTLDKLLRYKNIKISLITYSDIKTPTYREYFKKHSQIKLYSLYPCSWLGTKLPHFFLWRLSIHLLRDIYRGVKRPWAMCGFKDIDVFIDYHDFGFVDELRYMKHAKKIAWFHSSPDVFINRRFIDNVKYYDKVVVLTDDCANILKKDYSKYADKILRIYNPLDTDKIQKMANEKNKISGEYFCCVSRLTPDKDIETVLRGFDLFWQKNARPDIKMLFVGDGNWSKRYQEIATGLSSKNQFVFTGAVTNPFVMMKGARANILSSYGEGLPTVLIESMAVGTINIASDVRCGPREILLNGRAGLLFKAGDAKDLSDCLSDVYNKKVDVRAMLSNAKKSLNRFDGDEIVKEIISLIS